VVVYRQNSQLFFFFFSMEQRKLNRLLLKPLNLKTNEEEYFDGESFKNWNLRNGQLRLSDTTVCFRFNYLFHLLSFSHMNSHRLILSIMVPSEEEIIVLYIKWNIA
jgi:hypothetical protein